MNVYVIQMAAFVIAAAAGLLFLFDVVGESSVFVRKNVGFITGGRHPASISAPLTIKTIVLVALILASLLILQATHYDMCSFLRYWFPETQTVLPLHCR